VKFLKYTFSLILICLAVSVTAANTITNLGFESGNFNNWKGYIWTYSTKVPSINTSQTQVTLPYARRQVIISDTTAYDTNTGSVLKMVPTGYRYSARLGDAIISSDANPRCWEQSLQKTISVDSTNALLIMKFACVLQYSSSHDNVTEMEPRFKFSLLDENGNDITSSCANYDVYSSNGSVKGFQTYTPSGSTTPVKWRDWTTVGANLLDYIGKKVTIQFMTADCTGQYHYGYAYFVAETRGMNITVQYCSGDANAILTGPDGFESYLWIDSAGNTIGQHQSVELANPAEGSTYYCKVVSATGCEVTLSCVIARYEPNADFSYQLLDCNNLTNTLKFSNNHPATHGTLEYNWDFGDGTTSDSISPTHTFSTSGMHTVKLAVANPPSTCTDTVTKEVETFYPPLVGIGGNPYCCQGSPAILRGYGAHHYRWSNGSTADSILVYSPQTVWMIGYSSEGCYTDTIRQDVMNARDWSLEITGTPYFCTGSSTQIKAINAVSYIWNTGETTDSITVNQPGVYSVTGVNDEGCIQTTSVNISEIPLPDQEFSTSVNSVNEKHNSINCYAQAASGVTYSWDMGDGSTEVGSNISHTYQVDNNLYEYKITLTATNSYGCSDSLTKSISIEPFIPNVFTPNADGVNDIFASGLQTIVYDRHGIKLYEGNTGWDGTFNGKAMDNDTYFYSIRYTDQAGKEKVFKGYVTLIR